MRHYAKSNPFSNFLWIKDELLWNHSRRSCQNELVQRSFLWMIFHDRFITTLAARGMQELPQWISFFVILVSSIISAYCISDSKEKKKKCFTPLTFDKYLLIETFKTVLVWTVKLRRLNSSSSCLLGFSAALGVLAFWLFVGLQIFCLVFFSSSWHFCFQLVQPEYFHISDVLSNLFKMWPQILKFWFTTVLTFSTA